MMVAITVTITFDRPNREYCAGELLKGNVLVTLEKPMLDIKDIQVQLLGVGKVSWSESTGTGDDKTTTWYHNDETYFDQHVTLFQSDVAPAPIAIGTNTFPFSVILPGDLPESFKSLNGNVTYKAKVRVTRNSNIKKSKYKKSEQFTVHALVPVPIHLNELGTAEGTKNLPFFSKCCCCCSSGKISVVMKTDKGGYVPGESISFKAEISNNSTSELHDINLIIKQEVVCIANGGHTTTLFNKIGQRVSFPGVLHAHNSFAWPVTTLAPTYPPTNLGTCKIMKISYIFELEIGEDGGCCAPDVHFRIPFMLGSIIPSPMESIQYSSWSQVVTQQPLGFQQDNISNSNSDIGHAL